VDEGASEDVDEDASEGVDESESTDKSEGEGKRLNRREAPMSPLNCRWLNCRCTRYFNISTF
jgi:hypothetical protein